MQESWKVKLKARQLERNIFDKFLWGSENEESFAVRLSESRHITFAKMQMVRLFMHFFVASSMLVCFYIGVKRAFLFINFWAVALTFFAQMFLFWASGYQIMEKVRAERGLPIKSKHKSTVWKWGLAFYIMAWPFAVTQVVSFAAIFGTDQMCQTALKHGFASWRTVFTILSVFISPLALTIELLFNNLVIYARHIVLPLLCFAAYLGVAAGFSALLGEPVYGLHLSFHSFISQFDWEDRFIEYSDRPIILQRIEYCREHFLAQSPSFLTKDDRTVIEPDWKQTCISIGIMLALVVFSHVILAVVT
jgi:hypothetical protein